MGFRVDEAKKGEGHWRENGLEVKLFDKEFGFWGECFSHIDGSVGVGGRGRSNARPVKSGREVPAVLPRSRAWRCKVWMNSSRSFRPQSCTFRRGDQGFFMGTVRLILGVNFGRERGLGSIRSQKGSTSCRWMACRGGRHRNRKRGEWRIG